MLRLGGTATSSHMTVFRGLEKIFRDQGIDIEWVLYSDDLAVVDSFAAGEIDLAWNGPLNYVRIKQRLEEPCRVIAMRDVDLNFRTHFITQQDSDITTVEDLPGKRFAFGNRRSVEAGLLAYYFLKQAGINPKSDLPLYSFCDERSAASPSDQRDVVQRVRAGEYDAGAVSHRTLEVLEGDGTLPRNSLRTFWYSPGYSHCCFTAQGGMDSALYQQVADAFLAVDSKDPVGKEVLDAEGCQSFVAGILEGWEMLEEAALEEGVI